MRYRAILRGVDPAAKPQQSFGESLAVVREWAKSTLAAIPLSNPWKFNAFVIVEKQCWDKVEEIQ